VVKLRDERMVSMGPTFRSQVNWRKCRGTDRVRGLGEFRLDFLTKVLLQMGGLNGRIATPGTRKFTVRTGGGAERGKVGSRGGRPRLECCSKAGGSVAAGGRKARRSARRRAGVGGRGGLQKAFTGSDTKGGCEAWSVGLTGVR